MVLNATPPRELSVRPYNMLVYKEKLIIPVSRTRLSDRTDYVDSDALKIELDYI